MRRYLFALFVIFLAAPAAADQKSPLLDDLFHRLATAATVSEASAVEHAIWEIWTHRGEARVDVKMAQGIAAMNMGAYKNSLAAFDAAVVLAPDYAEAWNKRATVHYLMGNFEASVANIQRTLALEPRHFGALLGMGLIYDALGREAAAAKVWEKALTIHPHMESIKARLDEIRRNEKGERT